MNAPAPKPTVAKPVHERIKRIQAERNARLGRKVTFSEALEHVLRIYDKALARGIEDDQ